MSTSNPAMDEDYVVKLPSGDARIMSIDELDAALEAGTIHKESLVLAPGAATWTTLAVLAGLDEVAPADAPPPSSPSSIAPMMLGGAEIEIDVSLDDDDDAGFPPRRRAGRVVGAVFGAIAVLAVGFAIKGAISQTLATRAGEAALAALPPAPPPAAPVAPPAPPVVEAAPPPSAAPSAAPARVPSKATDKKKGKLPGAPKKK